MTKVTRERIVAASIFHVIRAYLLVYKGSDSFRGVKFAVDPKWSGWERLHFYITKYISEGDGIVVHSDTEGAEVAITFTDSNMRGHYGLVIPAVPGATAYNKADKAVVLPTTFGQLFDMTYNVISHSDMGQYQALMAVANSIYDAAYHFFYEQYETKRIIGGTNG